MYEEDDMDSIDRMFPQTDPQYVLEEKTLLSCLLNDINLVKRHSRNITPIMFSERKYSIMYTAMIGIEERGGKNYRPAEVALRMLDIDPVHLGDKNSLELDVEKIMKNDKEPNFYRIAHRIVENYRKRDINRRYNEMMADPENSDPDIALERMESLLELREKPNPFAGNCRSVNETMHSTLDMLKEIWAGRAQFPKIPTGYPDLDAITGGGFDVGSFAVIGAATGHGKTAAGINMAAEMAKLGIKTAFISMEQSYDDMSLRLLTSQSGVPRDHVIKEHATLEEQKKIAATATMFMHDDSALQFSCGPKTASEVVDLIRIHHDRDGTEVFFIDYIQRVKPEGDNPNMITMTVARLSFALGELCRELGIVIIACSQLQRNYRREQTKRKPTTYDLSESNFLECEASYIITLYRQDMVVEDAPDFVNSDLYDAMDESTMEFIFCKQRNGRTGKVKMHFFAPSLTVSERRLAPQTKAILDDDTPF